MTRSNLGKELERFTAEIGGGGDGPRKEPESIYDTFRMVSPHFDLPLHLDPFIKRLAIAFIEGGQDWCFSAPVQHGKTEAVKHAFIFGAQRWAVRAANGDRSQPPHHAYSTYIDNRARQIQNEIKALAFEAGLAPTSRDNILQFEGGSRIKFTGTNAGTLTGWPLLEKCIHVIDDPIGTRQEALSAVQRESLENWFRDVALTRRHPGASCLIMMARWTQRDLIGWIQENLGWPYVRFPAICDAEDDPLGRKIGETLASVAPQNTAFTKKRTYEWYQAQRRFSGEVTWASLWQGRPRNEGDALFEPTQYYVDDPKEPEKSTLPKDEPFITAYGCDLAYVEKTRADYSVLVRGRWYLWRKELYITDVWRRQWQADKFNALMRTQVNVEPGTIIWHVGGGEKIAARIIQSLSLPSFRSITAQGQGDPYSRAWPVAEQLWNEPHRKIFVRANQSWTKAFADEIEQFTGGGGDDHDDQVMALASLADNFLRGYAGDSSGRDMRRSMAQRYGRGVRGRDREED